MFLLQQIAPGAIAALLIAAAFCAASRYVAVGKHQWLGAAPIGIGYACGHMITRGWPGFPPGDVTNWLLYVALAAVPVGIISTRSMSARTRAGAAVALTGATLWLLLKPKFQHSWSLTQGSIWLIALAAIVVLHWWCLDLAAGRSGTGGIEIPLFVLVPVTAASIALLLSGSIVLGQLGIVLTAASLGAILLKPRGMPLGGVAIVAFAALLSLLLVSGYFYAELPAGSALLLWATAPLLLIRKVANPAVLMPIRVGAMLGCVATAVVLAIRASPPLSY